MEETNKIFDLIMQEFRKEYGEDAKLEDGDDVVAEFTNGCVIISVKDGNVDIKILGCSVYKINHVLPFFSEI